MATWQNSYLTPFVPLIPHDVEQVLVLHGSDEYRRLGTLAWSHQTGADLLSLYGSQKEDVHISWQEAPSLPSFTDSGKKALLVMPSALQALNRKGKKQLLESLWGALGERDTLLTAIHQKPRWSYRAHNMAKWATRLSPAASTWHWAGYADPGNISLIRVQKDAQSLELHALAKRSGYRFMMGRRLLTFLGLYGWLQENYLIVVPRSC
jgi:hypothetical protein